MQFNAYNRHLRAQRELWYNYSESIWTKQIALELLMEIHLVGCKVVSDLPNNAVNEGMWLELKKH